jgi:hypothetical protein
MTFGGFGGGGSWGGVQNNAFAKAPAHLLIEFKGHFGDATNVYEEWQFGLKCAIDPAAFVTADAQVAADGARAAFNTHIAPRLTSNKRLTLVQASSVGDDGKWARKGDGGFVTAVNLTQSPGSNASSIKYPPQLALAISLVTPRAGATGKGRFYLPLTGVVVGDDLRLTQAAVDVEVAAAKAFLNAINAIGAPIGVFSSKGYASEVTAVRVGRAVDTQTRRRGDLIEGYAQLPLV